MRTVLAFGMWGIDWELSGMMESFCIFILLVIAQLDFFIKIYQPIVKTSVLLNVNFTLILKMILFL